MSTTTNYNIDDEKLIRQQEKKATMNERRALGEGETLAQEAGDLSNKDVATMSQPERARQRERESEREAMLSTMSDPPQTTPVRTPLTPKTETSSITSQSSSVEAREAERRQLRDRQQHLVRDWWYRSPDALVEHEDESTTPATAENPILGAQAPRDNEKGVFLHGQQHKENTQKQYIDDNRR